MNGISSVNQNAPTPVVKTPKKASFGQESTIKQAQTPEIKEMPKVSFGRDLVKFTSKQIKVPDTVVELKAKIANLKEEIAFDLKHPDKHAMKPKIRLANNKELLEIYTKKLAALTKSI